MYKIGTLWDEGLKLKKNFRVEHVLNILSDENIDKSKQAITQPLLLSEVKNVFKDTENILRNKTIEEVCKYILWHGLLNMFGIFGLHKNDIRKFQGKTYFDKTFVKGDLLSVDFGTSNFGLEFSYTHTGIVIADFIGFVIIIPITSVTDGKSEKWPEEIQKLCTVIHHDDYPIIENDSYVLYHQTRSVSKNRITKYIGTIKDTDLMTSIYTNFVNSLC